MSNRLKTPVELVAGACGDRCAHRATVLADVLARHERAAARGKPWLTERGVSAVRERLAAARAAARPRPQWLVAGLQLRLGDRLIREFRNNAPCQVLMLDAFEAQHWPDEPIPNPLSRTPGESADEVRQRLVDTVKNLNRELPRGTIRFRVVPGAVRVAWQYAPRRRAGKRRAERSE